jgi:hypothetical protein
VRGLRSRIGYQQNKENKVNPKVKDIFMYALAGLISVGEIALICFMLFIWRYGASTVDGGVVNLIYGMALGYHSGFMIVLGYFFGSSKGSSDKNDLLKIPTP